MIWTCFDEGSSRVTVQAVELFLSVSKHIVRGRRVMPRQLLKSPWSPFLDSLTMTPFFQSSRISSLSYMSSTIRWSNCIVYQFSAFSISAHTPSSPWALPFFSLRMALVTSSSGMGAVSIFRSVSASSMSASVGRSGRFGIFSKCTAPCLFSERS